MEATSRIELENRGFADPCLTAWLCRHFMERKTRLELATPTLARWCSTTELFPHLATRMGVEPMTSAVTGRHSNQLNYRAILCCSHQQQILLYISIISLSTIFCLFNKIHLHKQRYLYI